MPIHFNVALLKKDYAHTFDSTTLMVISGTRIAKKKWKNVTAKQQKQHTKQNKTLKTILRFLRANKTTWTECTKPCIFKLISEV